MNNILDKNILCISENCGCLAHGTDSESKDCLCSLMPRPPPQLSLLVMESDGWPGKVVMSPVSI